MRVVLRSDLTKTFKKLYIAVGVLFMPDLDLYI